REPASAKTLRSIVGNLAGDVNALGRERIGNDQVLASARPQKLKRGRGGVQLGIKDSVISKCEPLIGAAQLQVTSPQLAKKRHRIPREVAAEFRCRVSRAPHRIQQLGKWEMRAPALKIVVIPIDGRRRNAKTPIHDTTTTNLGEFK
ncbi:MAG: hypothetical protein M3365_05020, partial [Gemmatimonadota bacterium]|nr:hypothetical protein [Gemmatimonadota bacterium]